MINLSVYFNRGIYDLLRLRYNWNQRSLKNRSAHIDLYHTDFSVTDRKIQIFHAAFGRYADTGLVYNAVIVSILGYTADAIAAHSTLGTIQVVHIHLTVCNVRRLNQNQSV